jgi:DNA-binding NarL/FixJ family response regulator
LAAVLRTPDVISEATAVATLSELLSELEQHPDTGLVLVDPDLGPSPDETISAVLGAARGRLLVIAVTDRTDDTLLLDVFRAGACGLVMRDGATEVLDFAVTATMSGGVFIDPSVASELVQLAAKGRRGGGAPQGLTVQQWRALALVAQGMTNKQIAQQLGVSPHTVKSHLRVAFKKIGAHDRIEAAHIVRAELLP